jgi:hypothetical protein
MAAYLQDDNPLNSAPEQIKKYINLRIDLLGLHVSAKLYSGLSVFILSAIVAFAVLFFLFFASYSFIMWYDDYYGNASTGAFIVSGFYLAIALFVYALRKPLIYNPLKKSVYNRMDFEEFHKETVVGPIRSDEDFAREINKVQEELENNDREIDFVVDDVKDYYSFESIKDRFVDDIFSNPKPMISTVLQGIMAFRSFKSGKRKRK